MAGGAGGAYLQGVMPDTASLYDRDWFAWTQDQAARLRDLRPNGLDVENLAEEIEDMGKSQRRAIESLLRQIAQHLLKLELLPWPGPRRHWRAEIRAFRRSLADDFEESPSLHTSRAALYAKAWRGAAKTFAGEWRDRQAGPLPDGFDPAEPRYDLDTQLLNEDWFPEPPTA